MTFSFAPSSAELVRILSFLKPLEDMMKKNSVYLVMRDAVGYPDPPKADLLCLQVSMEFLPKYSFPLLRYRSQNRNKHSNITSGVYIVMVCITVWLISLSDKNNWGQSPTGGRISVCI